MWTEGLFRVIVGWMFLPFGDILAGPGETKTSVVGLVTHR